MAGKKVTSTDIKMALAEYHPKDYFITECKTCSTYFPDPQGLLIFDGLAVRKSYTGPCITGYEIKVSRSDFLQDAKWHLYLQYCNEFYFVVPNGLISKDELPENVGLIYYYPESGSLKKRKKAMYRNIEEPVGLYKYIIFSRLEQDRTPFYEKRAEYAKAYIEDKKDKEALGRIFGGKMAEDLSDMQRRIDSLCNAEHEHELLGKIKDICKRHNVGKYAWRDDSLIEELDKALQSHYPRDLERVHRDLQNALDTLSAIEKEHSGRSGAEK
ncbi:MAG: MmcB family DNA repair protein [Clostridium sp.]|nr:MmcB family DNA repair protein [Clostridium sp.]